MTMESTGWEDLRVALVHHWLVKMRGGEKVLEAFGRIFPRADIYTLVCNPKGITDSLKSHPIYTSSLQNFPGAIRHYRYYLPFFPSAVEQFDLSQYDLVISSDASVCKGVLTQPETCHICYCHSPMRYVWTDYHHSLTASLKGWRRRLFPFVANYLRLWDQSASSRVDYFVANSSNVARRIHKYYRREASIIHPPVRTSSFKVSSDPREYYFACGELAPYKRFDLAIAAFNRLGRPLWIAGDGPDARKLRGLADKNIKFLGWLPDEEFRDVLSHCRAFVLPGEEDFGMIVPEANACGRPVIALGKGGALEVITPFVNGLYFEDATVDALIETVRIFEEVESMFSPAEIRAGALEFDEQIFMERMSHFISEKVREHQQNVTAQRVRQTVL